MADELTSIATFIGADNGLRTPDNNVIRHVRQIYVETASTVDAADTFTVTLANYGATTLLGLMGYKHTTDNSIIVDEVHTTAVTSGVVTVTVPSGTDDDKRIAVLLVV